MKKVLRERSESPLERFERLVQRGIIDRDGQLVTARTTKSASRSDTEGRNSTGQS